MQERVVKVTPEQFAIVQNVLQKREPVFGVIDYAACCDALRSIGIEPEHNTTYRFEVVYD
jgi:hypothetical protein